MYTLHLCIGLWLSTCGQIVEYNYPTKELCDQERTFQKNNVGNGYAVCYPPAYNLKSKKLPVKIVST